MLLIANRDLRRQRRWHAAGTVLLALNLGSVTALMVAPALYPVTFQLGRLVVLLRVKHYSPSFGWNCFPTPVDTGPPQGLTVRRYGNWILRNEHGCWLVESGISERTLRRGQWAYCVTSFVREHTSR